MGVSFQEVAGAAAVEATAPILNVQRMSTEDGPGLRTTVFLKGCSLDCSWCHNPESVSARPEVVWHDWKCIGSRMCDAACPENALSREGSTIVIQRAACTACGECVERCPSTALETLGKERSVADVFDEVVKDRNYYGHDDGGVTVSGGEPGLRPRFVRTLLEACREAGLHTAVDTCGMCAPEALDDMAEASDLVLYDVKEINAERHERFTGQSNERILTNLIRLAERMAREHWRGQIWIRTPLVPGATATDENICGIGRFLDDHLDGLISRWELCAFNNLARDKYRRLGRDWEFENTELLSRTDLTHFASVARGSGVDPRIVVPTGATRVEDGVSKGEKP